VAKWFFSSDDTLQDPLSLTKIGLCPFLSPAFFMAVETAGI